MGSVILKLQNQHAHLHTVPNYILLEMSSVWKLRSRTVGNIAVYREKSDKQIFSASFRKIVIFPHRNIIPHKIFVRPDFFIWIIRIRILLKGKRYSIQIQKNPNIRLGWTPKYGSCTPLVATTFLYPSHSTWDFFPLFRIVLSKTLARKSSLGRFCVCAGGLDILNLKELHWFIVFHISIWGAWSFVWAG